MFRQFLACALVLFCSPFLRAEDARERGDLAIHARAILQKYCFKCHGGDQTRSSLHILEHKELTAATNPVPFVVPKKPDASQIIHFLEDGSMPPSGNPRPSKDDVKKLREWIAAGAPSFPAVFDNTSTLAAIRDDLTAHPESAANLRYFSLAHLVTDQHPAPNLRKAERDFRTALQQVGVTDVEAVNDSATLFRFDVTKAKGWSNRDLFVIAPNKGTVQLSIYDVLLLEYPHGSGAGKEFDDYFSHAKLVRPILFLRADWVARALLDDEGKPRPLADDLRGLTTIGKRDEPCRGFGGLTKVPAAPKPEPRLPIAPLNSWYSGDVLPEPMPFPLTVEVIDANDQARQLLKVNDEFRFRVETKEKVRFVLLEVLEDGTARVLTTNKSGLFNEKVNVLAAEGNKPFKITDIVTGEKTATVYYVLFAGDVDKPLQLPTIVRSKHSGYPIYRFLFDAKEVDPSKVVRKVIPVAVKAE